MTLKDAIAWLAKEIPPAEHTTKQVHAAAHCVTQAAENDGPMIFAQGGTMQAINRHRVRQIVTSGKTMLGKAKAETGPVTTGSFFANAPLPDRWNFGCVLALPQPDVPKSSRTMRVRWIAVSLLVGIYLSWQFQSLVGAYVTVLGNLVLYSQRRIEAELKQLRERTALSIPDAAFKPCATEWRQHAERFSFNSTADEAGKSSGLI